jgi:AraC-like DNA-binding protein
MRSVPLVRIFWVHPFLQFFREAGRPVDRYLEEARVPPEIDEDLDLAFPSRPLYGVIDRLVCEAGHRDVGLRIGKRARIQSLGSFGQHVAGQATLGDAISTARELMSSVHTARRLTLSTSGGRARLASRLEPSQLRPTLWDDQFALWLLIDLVRSAAGPGWRPKRIGVQTLPRREWTTGSGLDGVTVRRGADATTIDFPRSLLSCRLAAAREQAFHGAPARRRAIDLEALPTDLAGCLQVTLDALLTQGQSDLKTLAHVVGSSVRTLHRRLSEQDQSFRALLAHSRMVLANRRLLDPSAQVIDIAFETGYSDPSHFTRAFRRWTGQTPVRYRKAYLATMAQGGGGAMTSMEP